jgi:hypothetical protein
LETLTDLVLDKKALPQIILRIRSLRARFTLLRVGGR